MARLMQRRMRCFYCNTQSRREQADVPRSWQCPHCDAVNHLDKDGHITDPPAYATAPAPAPALAPQYVRERSPPMAAAVRSPFCESCERNQALVHQLMAEYIPEEEHPDYAHHVATADAYRNELEERYPQVCESCIGQVRDHVRAAGYTAKTDQLRRMLEQSKQTKMDFFTPRQIWTLRIITLAKWGYVLNTAVAVMWHMLGAIAKPGETNIMQEQLPFWMTCTLQAMNWGRVDASCFQAPSSLALVKSSLWADVLTIWWNPTLKQKTNRLGGRMHGLAFLWLSRLLTLGLRTWAFFNLQRIPDGDDRELRQFRMSHGAVLVSIVISSVLTWKVVRIRYQSTKSFMQPVDSFLPQVLPRSAPASETDFKTVKPKADIYDTMAQSFTTSFGMENPQPDLPPSPTLTATTISYDASEMTTPYPASRFGAKSTAATDDMDWTPTRRRFRQDPIQVQPPLFSKSPAKPAPAPSTEPHSIFAKHDPNPFRNKIPAFPKGSIHPKKDPWKAGIWQTAPEDTKKAFLKEVLQQGGSDSEGRANLQETAVPRNVKRTAEMFKTPQLKYDYLGYVGEKTTGLEDSFNNMFSK